MVMDYSNVVIFLSFVLWIECLTTPNFSSFVTVGNSSSPSLNLMNLDFFGDGICVSPLSNGNLMLVSGASGDDVVGTSQGAAYLIEVNSQIEIQNVIRLDSNTPGMVSIPDNSRWGENVACPGDINGDMNPDVIISASAPITNIDPRIDVIFLNADMSIQSVSVIDPTMLPSPADDIGAYGVGLSLYPDVNMDGIPEILVGDPGPNQNFFDMLSIDNTGSVTNQIRFNDGMNGIPAGVFTSGGVGESITAVGDINGDTFVDIAVGVPFADMTGAVYIVLLDGNQTAIQVTQLNTTSLQLTAFGNFGTGLSSLGDLNGDGTPDFLVGAQRSNAVVAGAGAAYLVFLDPSGAINDFQPIFPSLDPVLTTQLETGDLFGHESAIQDLNGDGIVDLLISTISDDGLGSITAIFLDNCGDSVVTGVETCDDGNAITGDGCDVGCRTEEFYQCQGVPSICTGICGDGVISGNDCDDGNTISGDGCDASCFLEAGFQCTSSPSVCTGICGDGLIAGAEQCDDGNIVPGDGCDSSCLSESSSEDFGSGAIAGVVIAVVVILLCAIALILFGIFILTRKSAQTQHAEELLKQQNIPLLSGIEIGDVLGQGQFGQVFKGDWKGTPVALKTLLSDDIESFRHELCIMNDLRHPAVLAFYGVCIENESFFMVTEFMNKGDILEILRNEPTLTISDFISFCKQTASGMEYLHSQSVIHRDLACRNLLVSKQAESEKLTVKIADFGFSRVIENFYESTQKTLPIRWTAPEAIAHLKFTTESDVWSYGITVWEFFSRGTIPYSGLSNNEVIERVNQGLRLVPSSDSPAAIRSLFTECWQMDPELRPSFAQINYIFNRESFQPETPFAWKESEIGSVVISKPTFSQVQDAPPSAVDSNYGSAIPIAIPVDENNYKGSQTSENSVSKPNSRMGDYSEIRTSKGIPLPNIKNSLEGASATNSDKEHYSPMPIKKSAPSHNKGHGSEETNNLIEKLEKENQLLKKQNQDLQRKLKQAIEAKNYDNLDDFQ